MSDGARHFLIFSLAFAGSACAQQATREPPPSDEPDPAPRLVLPDESRFKASPADGGGWATIEPSVVDVSSRVTMRCTYTVGEAGIAVGGGVRLSISKFWGWAPPQTSDATATGYTTVTCSKAGVELEVRDLPRDGFVFAVVKGPEALSPGDRLTFIYGDTGGGRNPQAAGFSDRYAERGERFFIKVDGDGDGFFTPLAKQAVFEVRATQARHLIVFAPSQALVGEAFEVTIAAVDRAFNLVESYRNDDLRLVATGGADVDAPARATIRPDDRGAVRIPVTVRAPGIVRLRVEDGSGEGVAGGVSNPVLVETGGKRTFHLAWGDLQIHTNASDGSGSAEDVYRYARDVARLDVAAVTDHDHWGYQPLDDDAPVWKAQLDLNRRLYQPGRFVTFPGYEWTNWTHGHRHVLFSREEEAVIFSVADADSDHPLELWERLGERDCVTISHHCGGGPIPTFWKYWNARYEPVVEMASVHGVSEMLGHPRCIYSPVEFGMAQAALARGHRLGLIGSGDTHDGHPGLGSPGQRAGLAGIWTKALTREAVLEALRARRVYATTGCRGILRFFMPSPDGVPGGRSAAMGSVVALSGHNPVRRFTVSVVADAAPVRSITIVKNNDPVVTFACGGFVESVDWADEAPPRHGDYYYARVVQEDGEWMWSSPIWIETPERSGGPPGAALEGGSAPDR